MFERFEGESIRELDEGVVLEHFGPRDDVDTAEDVKDDLVITGPEAWLPGWDAREGEDDGVLSLCRGAFPEEKWDREAFRAEAEKCGAFMPDLGVTPNGIAFVFSELDGELAVDVTENAALSDVTASLNECDGTLCLVCAAVLDDPELADWPGLQADSLCLIRAVDMTDPMEIRVTAALSGRSGDVTCPMRAFMPAWEKGAFTLYGVRRERL